MIPGAPRIQKLPSTTAVAHIASALALPPNTRSTELSYELVRAVTWASTSGRTPVSTRTLLDRITHADAALTDDSVNEQTRRQYYSQKLDDLAAIGDLAALGRGQWVSTTGSIVSTDNALGRLHILVSGIPVRVLPRSAQRTLNFAGHSRVVKRIDDFRGIGLPVISLDDWARVPDLPLDRWTSDTLDAPLGEPDEIATTIYVYQPEKARIGTRQNNRWFPPHPGLIGRHLARRNTLGGWTEYAIVELNSGAIAHYRELDPADVRRLMYGLDHRCGNHTVANVKIIHGSTQIYLESPLPYPETRALSVLCEPSARDSWTVQTHAETALEQLRRLHITIRKNGG